jgi:hypothetical protein
MGILTTIWGDRRPILGDVGAARDSGADEFVVLPLSQGSLLGAIQRVSSTLQHFVDCEVYKGPCRRRRRAHWESERRRIFVEAGAGVALHNGELETTNPESERAWQPRAVSPLGLGRRQGH